MTFSASHAPFALSELRAPFSLTAAVSINLGLGAVRNMRSATATAVASGTISISDLRDKGIVVISAGATAGNTHLGYTDGTHLGTAIGALRNSTTLFGSPIKALFYDGPFGVVRLQVSGAVVQSHFTRIHWIQGASYTAATSVSASFTASAATMWIFRNVGSDMNISASANPITFYFD